MPFIVKIDVKPHHFPIFQISSHKLWRPVRVWWHAVRKYICCIENMKNTDFAEVVWLLYYFFFNRIHCRSLGTGDDFQHWNPHSYSERPRMEKKGMYSVLGGDCHVVIREVWPRWIVGNMLGECNAPYILETTSFTFWTDSTHQYIASISRQLLTQMAHSSLISSYILKIYCWTCSRSWDTAGCTLNNNQS